MPLPSRPISPTDPGLSPGRRRFAGAILPAALALGIAIRAVAYLNCRSLGLDEARLAVNVAARSFLGLWRPLDLDQTAPPLFLWIERAAFLLSGRSDCALRLLPVCAGAAAVALMYPLARRFLHPAEARLASLLAIFSPLLITYANAVKQYSVELLVAVLLVLVLERALRGAARAEFAAALAAGAVAPWLSLSSVFVLGAGWLLLARRALARREGAARALVEATLVWGGSVALAYGLVYRAASRSPYLQRFWELAFVRPGRPGFAGHVWKTIEDQVWGFVAGDPLIDRAPYAVLLHVGSVLVLLLCAVGCRWLLRRHRVEALGWVAGPPLLVLVASMLGLFPVAPRLTLFLLPGLIILFAAGVGALLPRRQDAAPAALTFATAALVLPLVSLAVVRTFELEPPRRFQHLVSEFEARRAPGEPVYVFARSLPPWIYYSTDWTHPDTARLRVLLAAARSDGPAFENAPSRGRVTADAAKAMDAALLGRGELLGLPSGMEWREVEEHVRSEPDSGWVEVERGRIEGAASPGVWVLASAFYGEERRLFVALERDAARRTFADLRPGSALVRYEFGSLPASP